MVTIPGRSLFKAQLSLIVPANIWGKRIMWAWILTFPGAGLVGGASFLLLHVALQPFFGTVNVK